MEHLYDNTAARHWHLSVGALVMDGERLLVLERPDGTLVLPTGTLQADEAPLDALRRELREEAGVGAQPLVFLGTTEMPFLWGERRYDKTILWHHLTLLEHNPDWRDPEDVEAGAQLRWLEPEPAAELFAQQGQRLGDWDYSRPVRRLLHHLG